MTKTHLISCAVLSMLVTACHQGNRKFHQYDAGDQRTAAYSAYGQSYGAYDQAGYAAHNGNFQYAQNYANPGQYYQQAMPYQYAPATSGQVYSGYQGQTYQSFQGQPQRPTMAGYAPPAQYYTGGAYQPQNIPRRRPNYRPGIDLNYETLSFFEAPLAFEVADTTLVLRGRLDVPVEYSFDDDEIIEREPIGNFQVSAETQLPNRWNVGAVYSGRFENISGPDNNYDDKVAGYVGGSWGTVFGGNVSDLVFETTRRRRNAVDRSVAGDNTAGQLEEWSAGYRGRYGPVNVVGVIDEEANYDVGMTFQRPIGDKDYRFTLRHNDGTYLAPNGIDRFDTRSIGANAEYIFGSSNFGIGGGYEEIDDVDRWFGTAGVTTKRGPISLTAEGHYGEVDGQAEKSALLGARYDLARGLAATAAIDYQDAQITVNGVNYVDVKDTRAIMSLIYGF